MERKSKFIGKIVLLLLSLLIVSVVASAIPVTVNDVEVNGRVLDEDETKNVERADELEVSVEIEASADVDDVRIIAVIEGYEDDEIRDVTDRFDMRAGHTKTKDLVLELPDDMEMGEYKLRVTVRDPNSAELEKSYQLFIDTARHALDITDIDFHPTGAVKAGSSLIATVEIDNRGQKDEDVEVSMCIPDLGVCDEDDIDDVESDDDADSEELWVRIDKCTEPGEYDVVFTAETEKGRAKVTEERTIEVVDGGLCAPEKKTVLTIGSAVTQVKSGEKAIFPVTLANEGAAAQSYSVVVDGVSSWGKVLVSPESVVQVGPGESSTVFVYITPDKKADAGEHVFTLTVKSGEDTLKQVALSVDVEKEGNALRTLEIVLIVLVALLVILGLVVGFTRMRGKEEQEEDEGKTYY